MTSTLQPVHLASVGKLFTATNCHLLGLIVERLTGRPFHEALHRLIFGPPGMRSAHMQGFSRPAVMFYHPGTGSYIIGSFNDMAWKSRAVRFMLSKVINPLLKGE